MRRVLGLAFCLGLLIGLAMPATPAAAGRVALVIGNSAYEHAPRLSNPAGDARVFAGRLKQLGFDVVEASDLGYLEFLETVAAFDERLAEADLALFYYAGHALQVNGRNYLVPVDAQLATQVDVEFEAVPVDMVLTGMQAGAATSLVFLDAGRDNPFARKLAGSMATRSSEAARGLAPIEPRPGMFIASATGPGNLAFDANSRTSPFTAALLAHLGAPGKSLAETMIRVRGDVIEATAGRQVPWIRSTLTHRVVLNRGRTTEPGQFLAFMAQDRAAPAPGETTTHSRRRPRRTPTGMAKKRSRVVAAAPLPPSPSPLQSVPSPKPAAPAAVAAAGEPGAGKPQTVAVARGEPETGIAAADAGSRPVAAAPPPPRRTFPWPPPKASAWDVIPDALVRDAGGANTLGDIAARITAALDAAKYFQKSFFDIPGGFAIVTQLEKIGADGAPETDGRWLLTQDSDGFSLVAYMKRLLFADPGRYRLIIMTVTDRPFSPTEGTAVSVEEAAALVQKGDVMLSADLKQNVLSRDHICTALIYEFRKSGSSRPELVLPSAMPGREHLVKARMWAALEGAFRGP